MHMYDKALAQHQQLSRIHEENVAWEVYVEALLKRFYSTYEDPMSDLKNIRPKGGTIQIYIDAFDMLTTKVEVPETQTLADECKNVQTTNFSRCLLYVPGHKCSGRFSLEIVEDSRDCEDETKVQCNEGVFGYEDKEVEMERGEPNDCNNESDMAAQPQISLMQSQG
nr:hypothetical protein [Tanacetum cinerariifolium]